VTELVQVYFPMEVGGYLDRVYPDTVGTLIAPALPYFHHDALTHGGTLDHEGYPFFIFNTSSIPVGAEIESATLYLPVVLGTLGAAQTDLVLFWGAHQLTEVLVTSLASATAVGTTRIMDGAAGHSIANKEFGAFLGLCVGTTGTLASPILTPGYKFVVWATGFTSRTTNAAVQHITEVTFGSSVGLWVTYAPPVSVALDLLEVVSCTQDAVPSALPDPVIVSLDALELSGETDWSLDPSRPAVPIVYLQTLPVTSWLTTSYGSRPTLISISLDNLRMRLHILDCPPKLPADLVWDALMEPPSLPRVFLKCLNIRSEFRQNVNMIDARGG
jgi:hypothetical protein